MKRILVTLMIGTLAVACGEKKETAVATSSSTAATTSQAGAAALPEGHPPVTATPGSAPAMPAQGTKISGTVVETMDSGGYTYIKVKTASGEEWAATPATKVTKGQNVTVVQQMVAEKFQSNTLKRTFDRIIFGSLEGAAAPAQPGQIATSTMGGKMPPGHPSMGSMMGGASPMGSAQQHMTSPAAGDVKVAKAEGPDAKTVAEVWAAKASLGGKPVVIRGKVVKFLGGIMGKNWLHLRDGSGSPEKADDDITVTTDDQVSVGDVVTVRGVVSVDKDFGAGYRYPVIVEQAKVSK